MTEEQRREIVRLAADWSLASFYRGHDQGRTPDLTDADRAAANAFYDYMDGLGK